MRKVFNSVTIIGDIQLMLAVVSIKLVHIDYIFEYLDSITNSLNGNQFKTTI